MQSTSPYVRHPLGHALTLPFPKPACICTLVVLEPCHVAWAPISQMSRIILPSTCGSVQPYLWGESKLMVPWVQYPIPLFHIPFQI